MKFMGKNFSIKFQITLKTLDKEEGLKSVTGTKVIHISVYLNSLLDGFTKSKQKQSLVR